MGATLLALLKKQPPYIRNHAEPVRILGKKKMTVPSTGLPAVLAHTVDPESGNTGQTCQIVSVESPKTRNPKSVTEGHVKLSCSCDFFKYYCEYPLSKWGAANIRHSNGEPASFTNPTNYPLLCVAADTLVETKEGVTRIDSLRLPQYAKTHNGYKAIRRVTLTGKNKSVTAIRAGKNKLVCTPEHPVFALHKDGRFGWVEAQELTVDHYVTDMIPCEDAALIPALFYPMLANFLRSIGKEEEQIAELLAEILGSDAYLLFRQLKATDAKLFSSLFKHAQYEELKLEFDRFDWMFSVNWIKIDSILDAGISDVYDIEVEDAHCFVGNNFLVHNCKHLYALGVNLRGE